MSIHSVVKAMQAWHSYTFPGDSDRSSTRSALKEDGALSLTVLKKYKQTESATFWFNVMLWLPSAHVGPCYAVIWQRDLAEETWIRGQDVA